MKKEEARKKAEEKAKEKAAKQQPPQPKFDPQQIAALLDKREPQRMAAAGDRAISTPSLGFTEGRSVRLSQSELDALRRRLVECWNPPVGASEVANLKVVLRVLFKPDGSVAAPPALVAGTPSPYGPAMAESAKRAVLTCQPFKMLRPENLRAMERHRDHFRSARHVRRLNNDCSGLRIHEHWPKQLADPIVRL